MRKLMALVVTMSFVTTAAASDGERRGGHHGDGIEVETEHHGSCEGTPTPSSSIATPSPAASRTPSLGQSTASSIGKQKVRLISSSATISGRAEYRDRGERRLNVSAKVLVPSMVPAAATLTEAQNLMLTIEIMRAGNLVASCTLPFNDIDDDDDNDDSVRAEYKLSVRVKRNRVRSQKGICDIDLSVAGTQAGVPVIQPGDALSVLSGSTSLLTTTF